VDKYLFVLQTEDSDQFVDIFGSSLVHVSHDDITKGFSDIVHRLLDKHRIISDVTSPLFGLWYVQFSLKELDLPADATEQITALTDAGKQ